jgi:hypothetical protein
VLNGWRLGWLALHLSLILVVSVRDLCAILARAETVLPSSWSPFFGGTERAADGLIGATLSSGNPGRNFVQLYAHAAGIEAGYGFFAPNVPENYKVAFEIHYPDGRTEDVVPAVGSAAAGVRLLNLYDSFAEIDSEEQRVLVMQFLSESVWREHREADSIQAVLGISRLPTAEEYSRGQKPLYDVLAAYTFSFRQRLKKEDQ